MKKITLGLITILVMCFLIGCNDSNSNNKRKEVIEEIQQTLDPNDLQVLIAFGNNFEAKEELIHSSELSAEGLIALCIDPYPMNLNSTTVRGWFKEAIERVELTADQQVQIVKIGEYAYTTALLLSVNLKGEGLVAICENIPSKLNINSVTVKSWFKDAIKRTYLTEEQKIQIAKSEIGGIGLF